MRYAHYQKTNVKKWIIINSDPFQIYTPDRVMVEVKDKREAKKVAEEHNAILL